MSFYTIDFEGFMFSTQEMTSSSSVALTKLTNRLNFLRERRAQITNEIKNAQNNPNDSSPTTDSS